MNIGGIGRGSTTTATGQPELLKPVTSAADKLAKTVKANQIKSIKIKVKGK